MQRVDETITKAATTTTTDCEIPARVGVPGAVRGTTGMLQVGETRQFYY